MTTSASTSSLTSLAGIGSGIDYQSLVDSIISADSGPATAMQSSITDDNAQLTAYQNFNSLLTPFDTAAQALRDGSAFQSVSANVTGGTSSNGQSILSVDTAAGADPGTYAIQVLQTAQAEKLSGASMGSATAALGITGEFSINNNVIAVGSSDTLTSIRDKINAVNSGTSATGVTASIITDSISSQRLVLTSQNTGSSGIALIDGSQGVAQQLGWLDGTGTIKHQTSAGAQSDNFTSATASIGSQLGFTSAQGDQTVAVGGQSVTINTSTDSLTSIASKLNALTGIQASVQSTTVGGATKYYLDIRNTTSFADSGNALEQLGVLAGGRSAVAQNLQSSALTAGDAATPASAATLITNLWNGRSAGNAHVGDTLTITGTRGDGSAVNVSFTVSAGSTVQDLLNALNNSTTGFGAGTRPATASIDASGHIAVTDGTAGSSSLALQIVANNEGGGRLDLGAFTTTSQGRSRQLVQGTDAKFTVDGVSYTRPTNTVSDVIADTTLNLTHADTGTTATVTVQRSESDTQTAVQSFVDTYNAVIDFIKQQSTATTDGSANPALYNDPLLRLVRSSLANTMLTTVSGAATDLSTPGMAGVALTKDGHLSLDATKFQTAFNTRFSDLEKVFMEQGTSANPSVIYTASTAATKAGTYDVNITQAGTQAQVIGSGFSGTYTSSGTPDTMTVTDLGINTAAQIQLSAGMTTTQIVDALNSAFTTATAQLLQSSNTMQDATGASPATSATLLTDIHQPDGSSSGVAVNDTIGYSGVDATGTAYSGTFTVGSSSTVGDLIAQVQSAVGSGATVTFANGRISVQSSTTGSSPLALNLTSGNQGGGHLDFGTVATTTAGHGILSLVAGAVGSQIQILQNAFGSAAGVAVSFSGGSNDATAQLGIAAGSVHGSDVQGTIGGYAATGSGRQLVGATGTPVDGLSLAYTGTATGDVGTLSFSAGLGASMDELINSWTDASTGTLTSKQQLISAQIDTIQQHLDDFNARLEIRRQALLQEYLAMDTAVAKLKAQGNDFLSAIGAATSTSSASGSSSTASSTSSSSSSGA